MLSVFLDSSSMAESDELAAKLAHRNKLNEGEGEARFSSAHRNVYTEFPEFSRKQIKEYEKFFQLYDTDGSKFLDQQELQTMMEVSTAHGLLSPSPPYCYALP